ncbi:putative ribonuclease H-like domain-containing protein [Tanacetum coccineum]
MSAKEKSRLGYGNQVHEGVLSYENEVFQSVFDSRSSDVEDSPCYKLGKELAKTSDFDSCETNSSVETLESMHEPVVVEPKVEKENHSFAFDNTVKHVKTPRETVKEQNTCSPSPKVNKRDWNGSMSKRLGLGYGFTKKSKGTGQGENRPMWNNVQRLNHQNKFVPKVVLTKTGIFSVNTARQNPFSQATETSTARKVNTAMTAFISAVRGYRETAVKASAGCNWRPKRHYWNKVSKYNSGSNSNKIDDPQKSLKNKGIFDSGYSRHMTGIKPTLLNIKTIMVALLLLEESIIEAARNNAIISVLPNTFFGLKQSLSTTACYVLNRVLVTKPQNKTPYIRPFGCHVTILNTIDHLGKFEEKSDEGFLVGYSLNSKAFRVYNLETKSVEENIHINFLENKPNVARKGPNWLFDLDYLTDSMNYQPVTVENKANKTAGPKEANHSAGTQDNIDAGNSKMEAEPAQEYFVLPLWSSYTSTVKSSEAKNGDEKPNGDTGPKTNEEPKDQEDLAFLDELERLKRQEKEANDAAEAFRKEFAQCTEDLLLQAGAARATSTNTVNTVSTPISTASPSNVFSAGGPDLNNNDQDDSQIPALEDIYDNPSDGIFTNASYDDEGAVADFTNLETTVNVSPIPTSRIHSIHPTTQILGDPTSAVQTRSKVHKSSGAHAFVSYIQKQRRNNHKDFQHCLFACFLSQIEPKKISQALEDESWVDAMQEELLQFKIQKVWILVDLPFGKKAIGTKWVYRNKKDERGVVVRNKASLSSMRMKSSQREIRPVWNNVQRVNHKNQFVPKAVLTRTGKIPVNTARASGTNNVSTTRHDFNRQAVPTNAAMKVNTVKPIVNRVNTAEVNVVSAVGGKRETAVKPSAGCNWRQKDYPHSALKHKGIIDSRCSRHMTRNKAYLAAYQDFNGGLVAFGGSKGYPRVSSFDLEAYSDSDYAGANLDRKSTTGEAEYVAAANCCGQVLWIQNQMLDYGFNFMNTKIYIDNESTICIVKNPVYHSKTKHIAIRHHFIRDAYEKKLIQVLKIYTDDNVADLLTKAFDVSRFQFLVAISRIYNISKYL